MSPNELCCNNSDSNKRDKIGASQVQAMQCTDVTTVFHAVFDYASALNK